LRSIAGDVPVIDLFSGAELGSVFGRERTVHTAIEAGGLSTRLLGEACRLAGFRKTRAA
jgi:hypothetical protein